MNLFNSKILNLNFFRSGSRFQIIGIGRCILRKLKDFRLSVFVKITVKRPLHVFIPEKTEKRFRLLQNGRNSSQQTAFRNRSKILVDQRILCHCCIIRNDGAWSNGAGIANPDIMANFNGFSTILNFRTFFTVDKMKIRIINL